MRFVDTALDTWYGHIAQLVFRLGLTANIFMFHGWPLIKNFNALSTSYANFMGVGSLLSLLFMIFAECFCTVAVGLGLLTRITLLPIIAAMIFSITARPSLALLTKINFSSTDEIYYVYIIALVTLLLAGPGNYSIDSKIS